MRDTDMKTFVALARNRHFGRTAAELHTTQPAISARLVALEGELGCKLIHRGDRSFALTAEGEAALARFEAVLADLDGLKRRLRGDEPARHEPLRIGAIDSVSSTWIPHLLDTLHGAFPDLPIELTVDGTTPLVQGMRRGAFDLIFCLHPVLDEGFRNYTASMFQMVWAGSPRLIDPDRTYSVAELAGMPIISFQRNSPPFQMIAPFFHDERVLASKLTSCNSLYAMINLLIDGFGVAAIPTVTILRELRQGLLHPIRVTKRFPAMGIIASYRATTDQEFVRRVVRYAKESAAHYCAGAHPQHAWTAAPPDPSAL